MRNPRAGSPPAARSRTVSTMAIDQRDFVAGPPHGGARFTPGPTSRLDPVVRVSSAVTTAVVLASVLTVLVLAAVRFIAGGSVGAVVAVLAGAVVAATTAVCSWWAQPVVSRWVSALMGGAGGADR